MSAPAPSEHASPARRLAASRLAAVAVGVGVVAVLAGDLVLVGVRAGDSSGSAPTPVASAPAPDPVADSSPEAATATVNAYYASLVRGDARGAYDLLCRGQQSVGYTQYAAEVSENESSGTGIVGWHPTAPSVVIDNEAQTPGVVTLAGQVSSPIIVASVLETAGWRVCSSNLGGVLPAPGTAAGPAPTGSPSGSAA